MKISYGLFLCLYLLTNTLRKTESARLYGLPYNPDDFVVAQPTCVHRLPLTLANRHWRLKGIRSYTVLNNSNLVDELNRDPTSRKHLEAYGYWEDDSIERGTWRGGNVGDTRAALTPFMAHRHFGESYKWMLYGDDDTIFYMTGVLKLLAHFDPEQPLAITDNIWFLSEHPSPAAPRCLPCGFNTSTISTNHSFTPRPACPFCTRALACGTYSSRYHCNATHNAALESTFGRRLFRTPTLGPGRPSPGSPPPAVDEVNSPAAVKRFREAMHDTVVQYGKWMSYHLSLKDVYPPEMQDKPSMDWEMREEGAPSPSTLGSGGGEGISAAADPGDGDGAADNDNDDDDNATGADGDGGDNAEEQEVVEEADGRVVESAQRRLQQRRGTLQTTTQGSGGGSGAVPSVQKGSRNSATPSRNAIRKGEQHYMNGRPWLSAALGRPLGGPEDPEWESLRLPFPFCAQHDKRLHARAAPSCLIAMAGHGGTGIIFSVGLMRLIAAQEALDYITQLKGCAGGDCLLSRLLWFRLGIGFTDPGTPLQAGAARYERFGRFIDSNAQMPQLITLGDPKQVLLNTKRGTPRAPFCDRSCVWLIENVVGTHVRGAGRQVDVVVKEMLWRLWTHRTAYEWVAEARRHPEVLAGRMTVVAAVKERHLRHNTTTRGTMHHSGH